MDNNFLISKKPDLKLFYEVLNEKMSKLISLSQQETEKRVYIVNQYKKRILI